MSEPESKRRRTEVSSKRTIAAYQQREWVHAGQRDFKSVLVPHMQLAFLRTCDAAGVMVRPCGFWSNKMGLGVFPGNESGLSKGAVLVDLGPPNLSTSEVIHKLNTRSVRKCFYSILCCTFTIPNNFSCALGL